MFMDMRESNGSRKMRATPPLSGLGYGRFMQADPAGYEDGPNLYGYVQGDPVNNTDPTGEAILTWTSPTTVRMTINYTIDETRARAGATPADISRDIASRFTGEAMVNGERVSLTAEAVYVAPSSSAGIPDLKTITIFPAGQLPAQAVTGGRPYVADGIGGSQVHATPAEGTPQMAHELGGHTSGAGDQYVGGRGADGVTVVVPGAGGNVMQDYRGRANAQTLGEIIRAPTNINRCERGVQSASGAC